MTDTAVRHKKSHQMGSEKPERPRQKTSPSGPYEKGKAALPFLAAGPLYTARQSSRQRISAAKDVGKRKTGYGIASVTRSYEWWTH